MEHYYFQKHKCILSKKGFNTVPDEIVKTCEEAVVFYKCEGTFVLGDMGAFCELREKVFDCDDSNLIELRRHLFVNSFLIESVENLVEILWGVINRYKKKYADSEVVGIEMSSYNMLFYGEETKNQFVEIKLISSGNIDTN